MTKFLIETSLTVTLRRLFEVEADTDEDAAELFANGEVESDPISEETVKVVGDEYVVSIEAKPDTGPQVMLRFRPEAWVNDYAMGVDPEQPEKWLVPLAQFLETFPTEEDFGAKHHERDDLRHEGDAPQWIRDWSGPFEVELADGENPWGDG